MFRELLRERLRGIVELSDEQVGLLEAHFALLTRWNQKLNLTAIRDTTEAIDRHYGESLFLGSHLPPEPLRICDIGSGGGFPGIPVGILRPDCSVALIESHQRKAVFLREAVRGMPNFRVISSRAEEVKDKFDLAVSRAVSYEGLAPVLRELCARAYLLTGEEAPGPELGFVWEEPVLLPLAKQRYLSVGSAP